VREVYVLIELLRLMVLPDPKALSRVEQPQSLLQDCQNIFVRHGLLRTFFASRIGETQLYLQSILERSTAGKQAAEGGNTQVDLPGSTGERLFARHPDP
jgi:hypothetical protein